MLQNKEHSRTRLASDLVAWMTTVSDAGRPSTAPVWFVLEADDTITVFSKNPSVRVRNIGAHTGVTFALNSDPLAHDVVVVNGDATVDASAPSAAEHQGFLEKYSELLEQYEWSPEWFAEHYPAVIRISIRSVRGR